MKRTQLRDEDAVWQGHGDVLQGLNSLCISTAASAEVLAAHLPDGSALWTQLLQGFLKSLNFLSRKSLHCAGMSLEASWTIPLEVVCRFTEGSTGTLNLAALPGHLLSFRNMRAIPGWNKRQQCLCHKPGLRLEAAYMAYRREHASS